MAPSAPCVVQTIGLTKVFRDFWGRNRVVAVDNLDLEVHPGEVFGFLGPNGSGKTTTIKILLGLLYPTRGRASLFGQAPTDVAIKARIGYLPEESYLYRFLDARETLDYYGRLFHQPRRERRRRIDMLLDMVGLTRVGKRRVGEYSKGMARRIGLAQALINDPDLLLLDEPTTGMDPIGTRQIKDLIRELCDRGKTVLLCSHLLSDVEDVCDRVGILYGGKRRALGDIKTLLSRDEMTQITTGRLTHETIDRIRELIEKLEGTTTVDVGTPSDRLEDYFLRIVDEARRQQVATSGAESGGAVAEFLRAERPTEGTQLVDQLVRAAHDKPDAPAAPRQPVPVDTTRPDRESIDQLVRSADGSAPADDVEADEPSSAEADKVDRSVLDALVKPKPQEQPEDNA